MARLDPYVKKWVRDRTKNDAEFKAFMDLVGETSGNRTLRFARRQGEQNDYKEVNRLMAAARVRAYGYKPRLDPLTYSSGVPSRKDPSDEFFNQRLINQSTLSSDALHRYAKGLLRRDNKETHGLAGDTYIQTALSEHRTGSTIDYDAAASAIWGDDISGREIGSARLRYFTERGPGEADALARSAARGERKIAEASTRVFKAGKRRAGQLAAQEERKSGARRKPRRTQRRGFGLLGGGIDDTNRFGSLLV